MIFRMIIGAVIGGLFGYLYYTHFPYIRLHITKVNFYKIMESLSPQGQPYSRMSIYSIRKGKRTDEAKSLPPLFSCDT